MYAALQADDSSRVRAGQTGCLPDRRKPAYHSVTIQTWTFELDRRILRSASRLWRPDPYHKESDMRTICEGTGEKPVESAASFLYPACPICGKEFSAQGRRHRYAQQNWWLVGCPRHYRAE